MWKSNISVYLFFCLLLFSIDTYAQTSISSPYSSFGIGNLTDVNSIKYRSMGGVGVGMRDNFTVNIKNPASYSAFDSTSFVFEGGIKGHYINLKTEDLNESYTSGTLSHLLFGFPVFNWWRSSFGLLPFSIMGYNVQDYSLIEQVGNVQYSFEGSGGLSRAFWGNAFRPVKNVSIGVNASYLFGTLEKTQKVTFPDSINRLSTITNNALSINNLFFDFGVQYHGTLNNLDITAGITYNPDTELSARQNNLVRSYLGEISGVPLIVDTISIISDEPGTVLIPQGYGVGFSIANRNRWLFSGEYKFDGWENFRSYGVSDSLTNRHEIRLGGQITPNPNSLSYVQRIEYRLGGNYYQSYLNLRDKQINGFGITFGVGLPITSNLIRRTRSMINIGFEAGRRGTIADGLIQENYYNIYMSISVYDWWFFKRRYK